MFRRSWSHIRICSGALLLSLMMMGPTPVAQAQTVSLFSDSAFAAKAEEGIQLLYNMQFTPANVIFDDLVRLHPDHPAGPFLKALNTWWLIMLDLSDESHDRQFYAEMDAVIRLSDRRLRRNRQDVDAMFFKGAALGFKGRLRSNRREYLRAARDGKRAMDYVLAVAKVDPNNDDFYFGWGIYDYFADVLPERYPLMRAAMVFFPRGDRERGIIELQRVVEHGRFINAEAAYFLLQINYVFEQDFSETSRYATYLRNRYPDNAFYHALEGRVYARWGRWERAQRIFKEILERHENWRAGYNESTAEQALYYLARIDMIYGQYSSALAHLQRLENMSLKGRKESAFYVMGRLRLGMLYDVMGNRQEAMQQYRQVLAMKDWAESHEQARRYLDAPYGQVTG